MKNFFLSGFFVLLSVSCAFANLIENGDFSSGNTGFISQYTFNQSLTEIQTLSTSDEDYPIWGFHTYSITSSPHLVHPFGSDSFYDHTSGGSTGLMLAIAGSNTIRSFWSQTISVATNTGYDFSLWATEWFDHDDGGVIDIYINNVLIQSFISWTTNEWTQFSTIWNSGSDNSAVISLVSSNKEQNDLLIDDVYFDISSSTSTVPEPTTIFLFGLGLIGLVGIVRRRM